MSLGSFLQIIIGLVLTYLILSLVTSEIQGLFSAQQEFKAKNLKRSILQILGEDTLKFTYDQNDQNKKTFVLDGGVPEDFKLIDYVNKEDTSKPLSFQSSPTSPSGWFYFSKNDNNVEVPIWVENKALTSDNKVWLEVATNKLVSDARLVTQDETNPEAGFYRPLGVNPNPIPASPAPIPASPAPIPALGVNPTPAPIPVKKQICYEYQQNQKKDDPTINSITELIYQDSQLRSLNQSDTALLMALTEWLNRKLKSPLVSCLNNKVSWLNNKVPCLNKVKVPWLNEVPCLKKLVKIDSEFSVSPSRKSVGFSEINPPELFGQTVIFVLQEHLANDSKFTGKNESIDDVIKKLKTKVNFYSPALPILIKIAEGVKLNPDSPTTQGSLPPIPGNLPPTLGNFQQRLTEIFKASQKQNSEVYSVNAKGLSFVLGLVIAVLANADTFYIIQQLNANTNNATSSLVTILDKNPDVLKKCKSSTGSQAIEQCLKENSSELKKIMDLDNLPIGWDLQGNTLDNINKQKGGWPLKIFGWFITAIAIAMGAPFWYKFLGNLVNFRKG